MPVTDRREPAVYVDIQDASYAASAIETGRVVLISTICDRGEHNKVLTMTSTSEFHKKLGKPNYRRTSQAHYLIDVALQYTSKVLVIRVMPDDAYWSNSIIAASTSSTKIVKAGGAGDAQFSFLGHAPEDLIPYFTAADEASYNAVTVGSWVFSGGDTYSDAVQVIGKAIEGGTVYRLLTNEWYAGDNDGPSGYTCQPYIVTSQANVNELNDLDATSATKVWYFYAKGAGTYYNNLKIKGVRNVQMEKMFTNANGVVLYPYLFMDLGIYYVNNDGTESLMEGPFTVSLTRRTTNGSIIKDLTSGSVLYIEDVINDASDLIGIVSAAGVEQLVTATDAEKRRLEVMLLLSVTGSTVSSEGNIAAGGITFEQGTDGTVNTGRTLPMYTSAGNLEGDNTYLMGLVKQAYQGVLTSTDGSIEQLPECVYPWYEPDYIITGGYPAYVQDGGRYLAEYRQDCIHLGDTGSKITSYSNDITARLNDVPWNCWTSALYVQYRRMFDMYTGEWIWMNPVYNALQRHLYCDGTYFLAEPVAGIEKGAIQEKIELAYKANHTERGDLQDKELNMVIVEPQGKYIHTQLTTWKRLSILKRLHVAKFVAYIRKVIPTLLKDILQRRATQYWIGQAQFRVINFLSKFLESPVERYSILKSFNCTVSFDDVRSELNVIVDITPIRAIERINVFIIVH